MTELIDHCPACGVSWVGDPIPEAVREHYGGATHYRREIAVYSLDLDRTTHYHCPDCGTEFPRQDPPLGGEGR